MAPGNWLREDRPSTACWLCAASPYFFTGVSVRFYWRIGENILGSLRNSLPW
jgi:hypothetical protein